MAECILLNVHLVHFKIKIYVYFITSMLSFILNIGSKFCSMKMKINTQMDIDAFDLQEIKSVGQSFHVLL